MARVLVNSDGGILCGLYIMLAEGCIIIHCTAISMTLLVYIVFLQNGSFSRGNNPTIQMD